MARQLVPPNVAINEQAGRCLSYARRVFGAPAVESTAWEAWSKVQYRHTDRSFPIGVAFPVFFDWWGQLEGDDQKYQYGHAAVQTADGKVWSSPLTGYGRAVFASVDDLVRSFGNGMKFVGWSEDISGVKVMEGDNVVTISDEEYKDLQNWKAIGLDAAAFKNGIVNSTAWTQEFATDISLLTPVINDLAQFKRDHGSDEPSSYKALDVPVYVKK